MEDLYINKELFSKGYTPLEIFLITEMNNNKKLNKTELSKKYGVSVSTIHRTLAKLEEARR